MDETHETTPSTHLRDALSGHAILACGVIDDTRAFPAYEHDEREAPFAVDEEDGELCEVLVSITDEGADRLLAWVRVPEGSDVAGVGIDLCSAEDFLEDERGNSFVDLLFTPGEKELIEHMEGSIPMRRARVFSAKESAFKSCAAPLRRWYDSHNEELFFEAMDFELGENRTAGGFDRPRRGNRVDKALASMDIGHIEVSFSQYRGMAFCVAVAVRAGTGRPVPATAARRE